MNFITFILSLGLFCSSFAKDLTADFNKYYSSHERLSSKDLNNLANVDIVFVPGILSEVFSPEDQRGSVDFSFITSDYFSAQIKHLKKNLKLSVHKILSSSRSVDETKASIGKALEKAKDNNRQVLLISHSLGGLALLDYLVEANPEDLAVIKGIVFLQSPFYGTGIATIFLQNPSFSEKWLFPLLPFFNTSVETIEYLSVEYRVKHMANKKSVIGSVLSKIPAITLSGHSNGHRSLFDPSADIIKLGCLADSKDRCLTPIIYKGPYDESDGLVPLKSSQLENVDSVILAGVDHGGPIVNIPFQDIRKEIMTETVIKLILDKQ